MGSMVLSTFMMFTPEMANFIFLVIVVVGFFGIYVPLQERKKRGPQPKPKRFPERKFPRTTPPPERVERVSASGIKLDQLKTLKEAGLLTEEEYRQRRDKMMKGR